MRVVLLTIHFHLNQLLRILKPYHILYYSLRSIYPIHCVGMLKMFDLGEEIQSFIHISYCTNFEPKMSIIPFAM